MCRSLEDESGVISSLKCQDIPPLFVWYINSTQQMLDIIVVALVLLGYVHCGTLQEECLDCTMLGKGMNKQYSQNI